MTQHAMRIKRMRERKEQGLSHKELAKEFDLSERHMRRLTKDKECNKLEREQDE